MTNSKKRKAERKKKRVVFIDLDGVLADFFGALGRVVEPHEEPPEIYQKGFYRKMPVNKGAKEAVEKLLKHPKLDIYIASKPCSNSPYCASEKYEWVREHFPSLYAKIILTCDKNLLLGDVLIDDHPKKWKDFNGDVLSFNPLEPRKSWSNVLNQLIKPNHEIDQELWERLQVQSAKGSDMTMIEDAPNNDLDKVLDECYKIIDSCCENKEMSEEDKRELKRLQSKLTKV